MDSKERFLAQSYSDAWKDYEFSLSNPKSLNWDWIIITASNARQADAYRVQIEKRIANNMWPMQSQYMVVPDLNGERIGSGGATLNALAELVQNIGYGNVLKSKILLLHSGGDGKRIPQYSACGKLFSPVPRILPNNVRSTVFDELLIAVSGIPARMTSGMLVLPGDEQMIFNPLQLDLSFGDAAGLSIKVPASEGVEHGVFVKSKEDNTIDYFLHKQSEENLRKYGAVDAYDNIDFDTGCIWVGRNVMASMISLVCENEEISSERIHKFVNNKVCLNFYGDLVYPLAAKSTLENYYKETPEIAFSEELMECRTEIWHALSGYNIQLIRMAPALHIHYGTTKELFKLVVNDLNEYEYFDWKKKIITNDKQNKNAFNNVLVKGTVEIPETVYIEDSIIGEHVTIGENTILSNVELNDVDIPSNVVVHGLKTTENQYICRIYGLSDNPKHTSEGTFLGTTLSDIMLRYNLKREELWNNEKTSIWDAKLFSLEESIRDAVGSALLLYKIAVGVASTDEVEQWKSKRRYSLNESYNMADIVSMLQYQDDIEYQVRLRTYVDMLKSDMYSVDALQASGLLPITETTVQELVQIAQKEIFPNNMRIYLAVSDMCKERDANWNPALYEDKAYEVIKEVIMTSVTDRYGWDREKEGFCHDRMDVELPVRVNFCGGPSDAPPYCLEHGGTMLNAAVVLNGEKPVRASVQRLSEFVIEFESFDLNERIVIDDLAVVRDCGNPFDTFALHKAVLLASGLVSLQDDGYSMNELCQRLGGGLYLSTSVNVPKGSGLGTSSIVATACLKAVREILGQTTEDDEIYAQVLLAEQLMATGGGWQDQVGGLHNGIKYFLTRPGAEQNIIVEQLNLTDEIKQELNERYVLIFSGQRRLARNVLREEMNQCIRNNPIAIGAIEEIRHISALMRYELDRGNITAFGKLLTRQFEVHKKIDKGATNTCIEYIFDVCDDLIDGKFICGAGGGGFLQVILKKSVTKEQFKDRIEKEFHGCGVEVWDCEILF